MQSCSSKKPNRGEQIIEWINEQQKDSLRAWLGEEFTLTLKDRVREPIKDANFFLGEFMEVEKFMHGKSKITRSKYQEENKGGYRSEFYTVYTDHSNLFQEYLGINPYKGIITIEIEQGKISAITIGEEKGKTSDMEYKTKEKKFNQLRDWMKKKYPEEDFINLLSKRDELAIKRLEEYKRDN